MYLTIKKKGHPDVVRKATGLEAAIVIPAMLVIFLLGTVYMAFAFVVVCIYAVLRVLWSLKYPILVLVLVTMIMKVLL